MEVKIFSGNVRKRRNSSISSIFVYVVTLSTHVPMWVCYAALVFASILKNEYKSVIISSVIEYIYIRKYYYYYYIYWELDARPAAIFLVHWNKSIILLTVNDLPNCCLANKQVHTETAECRRKRARARKLAQKCDIERTIERVEKELARNVRTVHLKIAQCLCCHSELLCVVIFIV